jgi:thiopeptide-type bacteriocin biosynthesis protein
MGEIEFKRNFVPGDEWIYFKIYSGAQTADKILEKAVKPAISHLLVKNKIDHWFFIRYSDPYLHLRVRLHYSKHGSIGLIVKTIHKYISNFVEQELVWKVQIDTYQREVERYGLYTMELSESFFYNDSKLFISVLPYFNNINGETLRWHFSIKSIDYLLECFKYSLEEKLRLMEVLKESFGREFGVDRNLKDQLNSKFAKEWKSIEKSMNSNTEKESLLVPILCILNEHKQIIIPLADEALRSINEHPGYLKINDLVTSYIHMMMNRYFRSKQRVHELVLYDFLYRYYKSALARLQATNKENVRTTLEKV